MVVRLIVSDPRPVEELQELQKYDRFEFPSVRIPLGLRSTWNQTHFCYLSRIFIKIKEVSCQKSKLF